MDIRLEGTSLVVGGVPAAATTVRLYVNGVRCHTTGSTPSGTVIIPVAALDTPMRAALPTGPQLVQCYALDSTGVVLTVAQIADVRLPPAVASARSLVGPEAAAALGNRLVASALHGAGNTHHWDFPVAQFFGAAGADAVLCFRILFDTPDAAQATVEWTLPAAVSGAGGPPRARIPAAGAWGEIRAVTQISADCAESVFVVPAAAVGTHPDRAVRCVVAAAAAPLFAVGALRYAVYAAATGGSLTLPPVLGHIEEAEPPEQRRAGRKLAVLVGVSKYTRRPQKRISDLEYADDDIVQWFTYLRTIGFECRVYGDEFSPWPRGMRVATSPMPRAATRSGTGRAPCGTCAPRCARWSSPRTGRTTGSCSSRRRMAPGTAAATHFCACCRTPSLAAPPGSGPARTWTTSWPPTSARAGAT